MQHQDVHGRAVLCLGPYYTSTLGSLSEHFLLSFLGSLSSRGVGWASKGSQCNEPMMTMTHSDAGGALKLHWRDMQWVPGLNIGLQLVHQERTTPLKHPIIPPTATQANPAPTTTPATPTP